MKEASYQLAGRYWLEIQYCTLGKFKQALGQARLRYELAKKRNSPGGMASSQWLIGYNPYQLGELVQARAEAQTMLELAGKNNLLALLKKKSILIIKGKIRRNIDETKNISEYYC